MNVLIIGAGARENALALAIARSPQLAQLYAAPGNPGTARCARNVALDATDHRAVIAFCRSERIDFVVVGPEAPLVAGLADDLRAEGIGCFGPGAAAAQLEGSKAFTKDFCREFGVPTAAYARFRDAEAAAAYIRQRKPPVVVKADGLAAGKGVVIAETIAAAEQAARDMLGGAFGAAGAEIVVEDFLRGEEASFFAICDGARAAPFGSAQDHKRVGVGDIGPNTGGMGAYSPIDIVDEAMSARIMREIIEPTIAGMAARGTPFRGFLFAGLMIGDSGAQLIEYNVRLGDPEAEVLLARFEGDLLALLVDCERGALPAEPPIFSPQSALAVVMAARGYPGTPLRGTRIRGVEQAEKVEGVTVLHAGSKIEGGALVADGGRVLAVTALGADLLEAQARAYSAVDLIDWPEGFCRRDIGWRAVSKAAET